MVSVLRQLFARLSNRAGNLPPWLEGSVQRLTAQGDTGALRHLRSDVAVIVLSIEQQNMDQALKNLLELS